ncbi:MAG: glycosyltransferase [Muribaculum sp.]|nr:glycosyltransferase [Muribaculum sp.]
MNILFFTNHYPDSRNGGIENVTRMLSEQFRNNGHSVDIAYLFTSEFDHSDDSIFIVAQHVSEENIYGQIRDWVVNRKINVIINRSVIFATPLLRKAIEETGCKILTTYNNKPTLAPPTIKEVWMNKTTSLWKKFYISLIYPVFRKHSIKRLRVRHQLSYANADKTVLLSDNYIPEYAELMQISSDNLVVMNNPIRNGLSISDVEFKEKKNCVLMVTRLDETQKCIIKALNIWRNICNQHHNWELKIIGNGPDKELIMDYAQKNRINNVKFLSACNPIDFYRESSIFLMTSRNEGWPNTINEAMRMGCVPIVIDTFSAIYDMVDNGENGLIISQSDDDTVKTSEALNLLMIDNNKRHLMAISASKKTQRLSIEIIAQKWMNLLDKVLEQ